VIRPATTADLDALVHGNVRMALETENLALDAPTLRAGVRAIVEQQQPGQYFVYEVKGRVVGQLLITYEWSDWRNRVVWWIQSVWVDPAHRGEGVFRQLYAHARGLAQAAGAGGLRLYVDATNRRAQAVYRALGMNGDHYRVFEAMFDAPPAAPGSTS
jgi:ribosomal protein S18 acetylase RimI-like enzyme